MKQLIGVLFFLITSVLCEAQLQEVFKIKKIIVGEQHKDDAALAPYLFNYEMDDSWVKQGNFSIWFFSKTNDTTLVAEGQYKDGYLDDTCRWFFVGTKNLYMQTVFTYPQALQDASKFTVYYSGKPFCEKACKDGLFEIYFPGATKQLKERLIYTKDKANGIHEGFYDNGKLAFKYKMVNGVQDGFYENYDEDGFIKNKGYVNSQTEECYMEQYADRGRFKNRIMKTKAGQPVYDSCIFKNNRMSYRKYYNGKSIDSSFEFYYNGQLLKEEVYDASGNGYFKKYYDNGTLQASATYKNRLLDGPILNYYQNGNKKSEENYVSGASNGKSIEWYEAGNIKREQFYVNNKLEGYRKTYYENGKLTSSAFYKEGRLNGVQKTYNENGQILTEKIYSNGILDSEKKYKDGKEIKIETPKAMYSGNKLDRDGKGEEGASMEAYDLDESDIQSTREIKHDIIYKSKQDIECSAAFTDIKPIFNSDTFVTHFQQYLTTPEGKWLKKISKEVNFYITTTENKSASTGQYSRVISNVTYYTALNKKQQKAFLQFLLSEKLMYNDSEFKNSVYKLDYELSIIPGAFNK